MKKIILWTLVVALLTLAIPMTLGLVFGGREEPEADGDEDEADFTPVTPPETVCCPASCNLQATSAGIRRCQ